MNRTHAITSSRDQQSVMGTSLGKSSICGTISALEYYRKIHAEDFPQDRDAQVSLRVSPAIRELEKTIKVNVAARVVSAQILKASGSSSAGLHRLEIIKMSDWCLSSSTTMHRNYEHLRDRAMLLISTNMAFRGASIRDMEWSDIFISEECIPSRGDEKPIKVLVVASDNSKVNTSGRIDEFGGVRHKEVSRCAIGALALHAFSLFQFRFNGPPNFVPDFSSESHGKYGLRDWWKYVIFPAACLDQPMTYATHYGRVRNMFGANDVSNEKATHAGRPFAAQTARRNGATVADAKALGGWSDSGSFRACYERSLPLSAIWAVAGFNGADLDSYAVPRAELVPPHDLSRRIFPWVEDELKSLQDRTHANCNASDIALKNFLSVLVWFRDIILQDAAELLPKFPKSFIYTSSDIFSCPAFTSFQSLHAAATLSSSAIADSAYQNLPEKLVQGLKAVASHQHDQLSILLKNEIQSNMQAISQTVASSVISAVMQSFQNGLPVQSRHPNYIAMQNNHIYAHQRKQSNQPNNSHLFPRIASDTNPPHITALPTIPPQHQAHCSIPLPSVLLTSRSPEASSVMSQYQHQPAAQHTLSGECVAMAPHSGLEFIHSKEQQDMENARQARDMKWSAEKIALHIWDYLGKEWVPRYNLAPVSTIQCVWNEWSVGINGQLSTGELERNWGSKWRRNIAAVKQEWSRRRKIVDLIEDLKARRANWNTEIVLRFLTTTYSHLYSARQFSDYITVRRSQQMEPLQLNARRDREKTPPSAKSGREIVIDAALAWHPSPKRTRLV